MAKALISHAMFSTGLGTYTIFLTLVNGSTYQGIVLTPTPSTPMTTQSQVKAFITASVLSYSQQLSLGMSASDIVFPDWTIGIENAPVAAITNVATDAKTDYDALSLLLSDVAAALNATNTRLNEVAAKENTILSALRTLGFVTP